MEMCLFRCILITHINYSPATAFLFMRRLYGFPGIYLGFPQRLRRMTRKLLAEYDGRLGAVMISWPHEDTDWAPMLDQARECYRSLAAAIIKAGCTLVVITPDAAATRAELRHLPSKNIVVVEMPTNDTWIRDYGMLTLEGDTPETPVAADFQFNGWGLKFASNLDNGVTARLLAMLPNADRTDFRPVVLEGGSVETDGKGTVLTTSECLLTVHTGEGLR